MGKKTEDSVCEEKQFMALYTVNGYNIIVMVKTGSDKYVAIGGNWISCSQYQSFLEY